jgi:hypothetical protein
MTNNSNNLGGTQLGKASNPLLRENLPLQAFEMSVVPQICDWSLETSDYQQNCGQS